MKNNLVSVIIITKNEERVIRGLLLSINNQSYRKLEIILVDNNSSDNTKEIAKSLRVRVLNCGPERSAQRNYGAKISKGYYLLFLDADMTLSKKVIEECMKVMATNNKIGAVTIPETSNASNFWEKVKAFERSLYNIHGDPITDAARFFRKDIFIKVGGYDETITGPEDWDLPETIRKKGFKIGRIEEKIYHQERIPSISSLAKKKFCYALPAYKYLSKHNIPVIGSKTIYFLRPIFYKNWKKILTHPILSSGLFLMLLIEQMAGGLGYIYGRLSKA